MANVYYHYPDDKQFSLDFVNPNPGKIVERIVNYDGDVAVKVLEYDLDQHFYVVYTTRVGGGAVKDLELDLRESIESMGQDNGTIVSRLLEIYESLIEENENEEGVPVEAYKDIGIDELPDALDRTDWDETATEVAGRLASNLILKHALPNANHRTAVAMIQFYLRRVDSDFSMPKTAVEIEPEVYDWREWVNSYINESKRLLTIRRKNVKFKYVRELGGTTLVRKHDVRIPLSAYELDMPPSRAKKRYTEKHERLWIEFVEEAVERAGKPELKERAGVTKPEFAEEIRSLD
ncbi:hypothetical protein NGM10_07185 [Halorussus salilacus]|uniref:hypothetical protein n=1 Tax=Halorussus salilacus TaxID=2953750 RepID=UPI00209FA76E|nr:hypothetical protein [Halorussus salilacus]USZ69511.1 hypothetical protein NGM10_07185 [Halorussus salilacus]